MLKTQKYKSKSKSKSTTKTKKPGRRSMIYKSVKRGEDLTVKQFKFTSFIRPYQGVTVSNYAKYFISPWNYANAAYQLKDLPEFGMWRYMYDRYRITGVAFNLKPRVNVLNQLAITNSGGGMNDSNNVYYTVYDRDGPAPSSVTQIKRYKSCRVHSQLKGCKMGYRVKWPKGFWLDTTQDVTGNSSSPSWQQAVQTGVSGGITIYGENFPEQSGALTNYIWADLEVTFTVAFQTYNPRSITINEVGSIVIGANDDLTLEEDKPCQQGTLADDISGEPPTS